MLHIKADKAGLAVALKRVLPCVERKSTIPILANVIIVAKRDGIRITGTDLEVGLTVVMGCKVLEEGRTTIPARKLADTLGKIKTLEAGEVELAEGEGNWITLTCGPLAVKLVGMNEKNFPSLEKFPAAGKGAQVDGKVIAGMIARTRYAIATEESRHTMNGALLMLGPEGAKMVATDGYRLAVAEYPGEWEPMRALIPSGTIDQLAGLTAKVGGTVELAHNESHLFVCGDGWELVSRLITGQFPNWEAVMPKDGANSKQVTLPGAQLKATVVRIAAFANERSHATRWEMVPGEGLRVSASCSETGEASETIPAECDAAAYIGFDANANYVMDVLNTLAKDQAVTLAVRDHQSRVLWIPAEADGWRTRCVMMPLTAAPRSGRRNA